MNPMKTTPFWWEDAPREKAQESPLPTRVDVAVIGSGYTGLNAALVLARSGLSVSVFEAGQLGEGASSRNGGMVGPSFHKLGIAGLKACYGVTITNEIIRESVGFVDFLEEFLEQENIQADFVRCGRFRGAFKPRHFDTMACELEALQENCGLQGGMIDRNQQDRETGAARFYGGAIYHSDGGLHPGKYHSGLVDCARRAGVTLLTNSPVVNIQKVAGGFQLSTPAGQVTAERVAICTNGYTGPVFSDFKRCILPLRSAMIATEVLPEDLMAELMPKGRVYSDSRRIVAYYRPSPDGHRVLFGSRATGIGDQPEKNARLLHKSMGEIYPQLKNTAISHVWSGLVAYTFDHAPHIGQRGGLDYAMGYCGSGVARSTYFGQKLAYKILGKVDQGHTAFDDLSFKGKPLYTGNPWFMPAILNWHRMADRFGF